MKQLDLWYSNVVTLILEGRIRNMALPTTNNLWLGLKE